MSIESPDRYARALGGHYSSFFFLISTVAVEG